MLRQTPLPMPADHKSYLNDTQAPYQGSILLLPAEKSPQYISIFEDSLDQLGVLMDIEACHNKIDARPLGEEITRILKDQRALESRYKELVSDQESLKSLPNKTRFKDAKLAITDISHQLSSSTQQLAKGLKSHPSVSQNLQKIQNERSVLQTLISKSLRELKEQKFESLNATVEEEYRKKDTLQNTINSETEASELLKELQKEVGLERKLLDEEAAERNAVIQQLKDTIQEINSLTTSEQRYIKRETRAHEASVRQKCQTKESHLEKERDIMQKKIAMEVRAHQKVVDFLTMQRTDLERQIQDWMQKYEEDTEQKSSELEQIKQRRTSDLEKFEQLVIQYEELERVVEEDRLLKAKEAEEERFRRVRQFAATRLQRWWKRAHARIVQAQLAMKAAAVGKRKKAAKK